MAGVSIPVKNLLLILCLPGLALAAPFTAIRDGESFTYKVGFAVFSHAGNIVISGQAEPAPGEDRILITADTRSRGFVRGLYEFDSTAVARIDRPTGRLLGVKESGSDPKRPIDNEFQIDYERRRATFTDRVRPHRSAEIPLPGDGDPIDLISALVQTREWDLKPGEKRELPLKFSIEHPADLPVSGLD